MNLYNTVNEAYADVLKEVWEHGARSSPRGMATRELEDLCFQVDQPASTPIETASKKWNANIYRYTHAEFALYDSLTKRAQDFSKHAPFWDSLQNPDGTVNSAYGYLLWGSASCGKSKFAKHGPSTPWEWAKNCLMQDKDTRQAILRFSLPSHQWFGNKDQVCTMHGHFRIREDRLNLTMVMRSNDAIRGLVYDMPWFCSLIFRMRADLLNHYPELKDGTYTHFAHSMHIYERDEHRVKAMLEGD